MAKPDFTPEELEQNREDQARMAEAALQANQDIQEGAYGGFLKGAPSANPGTHFVPFSSSLGRGGTSFQDSNQTRAIKNMREADKAYREIGIIRNVIDIMTDFTSEGLNVHHPVAAQERFYRAWLKKVDMEEVAKQALRGMYKWANVGLFRFWGKIRPKTRKEMMAKARALFSQGKDKEAIKAFFREDKTVKRGRIPVRYSCIPPFRIRIIGSLLFDTRSYWYNFPQVDRMKILDPDKHASTFERKLLREIPDTLKNNIRAESAIELPEDNFSMLHYKRDCSRLWADPIILPIMQDLRYKQVLRRLDISVAESIINPITIFKLGKTVEGFGPTKEQFQNMATLLKTPVATKTLVWSDLIEVEQHFVDAKEVFTTEKYMEVDEDILAGLGVSQVLITGGAKGGRGSFGNAFLSVRTLMERLEDGRQEFMKFLNAELELVRDAMGWKKAPIVTWDKMNLRDEAAEKRILIELLDRKIISAESALDQLGFDSGIEMARKIREDKKTDKTGIPHSVGPFEEAVRVQQDQDPARLGIDIQKDGLEQQERMGDKQLKHQTELKDKDIQMQKEVKKEQIKQNKQAPKPGPGRPNDKGDPSSRKQKTKRETKPVGMGSADVEWVEQALENRMVIEDYLKPKYLESCKKENLRQLTKEEKEIYNGLVRAIWSLSGPTSPISLEWVELNAEMLASGGTTRDGEVYEIHARLVSEYRTTYAKSPTLSKSHELFAEALVISLR